MIPHQKVEETWSPQSIWLCLYIAVLSVISTAEFLVAQPIDIDTKTSALKVYGDAISVGVYAGISPVFHQVNFTSINGFPSCCPQYTSGSGLTGSIGASIDIPFEKDVYLSLRLSTSSYSGTLTAIEDKPIFLNGALRQAQIEHRITSRIHGFAVEPVLGFQATNKLHFFAGIRADMELRATFEQGEKLLLPEVGRFETGTRFRNQVRGVIPGLEPVMLSTVFGVRYTFPLNKTNSVLLHPELSGSLALTRFTQFQQWKINTVRIGATLDFALIDISESDSQLSPDDDHNSKKKFTCSVFTLPNSLATESTNRFITVEEYQRTDYQVLLPSIFFDEDNDGIPLRYAQRTTNDTADLTEKTIRVSNVLSRYYNILDILGRRMKDYPTDTLVLLGRYTHDITGTSASLAQREEQALKRSKNIIRYLQAVWGIASRRLSIKAAPLPRSTSPEGIAELRRVDLYGSPRLLAPVIAVDIVQRIQPTSIRLRPSTSGTKIISSWEIVVRQKNTLLKTFAGYGEPPLRLQYDFPIGEKVLEDSSAIEVTLAVQAIGANGFADTAVAKSSLLVHYKPLISAEKGGVVQEYSTSLPSIPSGYSAVSNDILGDYTDGIMYSRTMYSPLEDVTIRSFGDTPETRKVSEQRAIQTATAIGLGEVRINESTGTLPYANTYPEGRFYNRTISIHGVKRK